MPKRYVTPGMACGMALALLAGCGGGGLPEGVVGETRVNDGSAGYRYDPSGPSLETYRLTNGNIGIVGVPLSVAGLPDGFDAFARDDGPNPTTILLLAARTPTDGGQYGSELVASGSNVFELLRLENTLLPTADAGEVTYVGVYAGQYARLEPGDIFGDLGHMFGDARIFVDFEDGSVSGEITGRANSGSPPELAADVMLLTTQLVNGRFSGDATGGAFSGGTSAGGTYDGLIVGDVGQEIVAGVQIDHSIGTVDYFEIGGIIASSD